MVEALLQQLKIDDGEGGALTFVGNAPLQPERRAIYAAAFPELADGEVAAALYANPAGEKSEQIVHIHGGSATAVTRECAITLEDLPPGQLVEFRFTADGPWLLSKVCLGALEEYRRVKFGYWRDLMLHPTCEAAFKRMLKMGLITRLYDDLAFPELPADRAQWEVIDEKTGNTVHLPHPVHELRIWDAAAGGYRPVAALLEGAPAEGAEAAYWTDFITQLETEHGKEYIDALRAAP